MVVMVGPESWHGGWRTEVARVSRNHPKEVCSHTAAAAVGGRALESPAPGAGVWEPQCPSGGRQPWTSH